MQNRIREVRKKKGFSGTVIAEKLGITPQYYYEIERGKKRLSADIAAKLSGFFGVTSDYLLGLSNDPNEVASNTSEHNPYILSPKEERDIAKDLEKMLSDLESGEALAFHGEPLDDESKELLRISLENSLRLAKQVAKQKFTPKKHRK